MCVRAGQRLLQGHAVELLLCADVHPSAAAAPAGHPALPAVSQASHLPEVNCLTRDAPTVRSATRDLMCHGICCASAVAAWKLADDLHNIMWLRLITRNKSPLMCVQCGPWHAMQCPQGFALKLCMAPVQDSGAVDVRLL